MLARQLFRATLLAMFALSAVQCSAVQVPVQLPGQQPIPMGTPVALPDVGGRLLYSRDRALWSLEVRTGQPVQVARAPEIGQITSARWSADGAQLAYSRYEVRDRRFPVSEVVVAAPDGSGERTVLPAEQAGTFFQAPVWGPGEVLYVIHTGRGADEPVRAIVRVDIRTGERTKVVDEAAQFDVSPDGRWLALVRTGASWPSLVIVDLQSAEERTLVPERAFEVISSPRFDPSSQTLLFSGASTGAPPTSLSKGFGIASLFLPSTARAHGPPMDLYTASIAGVAFRRVAALGADDPTGAWSPDGSQLAVLSIESLAVLSLTSGQPRPILTPGGSGTVDWTR